MKKYIDLGLYGVGIGMFWYLLSLFVWGIAEQSTSQILVTVIGSGLMGLSALIYQSDGRPPLYKSIVHFIAILILVVIMTSLNGWIEWTSLPVLGMFVVQFLVIYLVIWTSIYLIEKRKVKRINENLRKTRR